MTLDSFIIRTRRRQQDLFRDVATVSRPITGGTISTSTNVYTPSTPTLIYSGACLLRAFTWEGTSAHYGDVQVRLRRLRAWFPVDTNIEYDDVVVPTASTFDESLIGVGFRVIDPFRDGWQISRKVIIEEILEP